MQVISVEKCRQLLQDCSRRAFVQIVVAEECDLLAGNCAGVHK